MHAQERICSDLEQSWLPFFFSFVQPSCNLQAAFGRSTLAWTSFLVYAGLGFGLLGSSLALPFGLYVLVVQRVSENIVLDTVTPPSRNRKVLASALILAAVLVLLPNAQDAVNSANDAMFL